MTPDQGRKDLLDFLKEKIRSEGTNDNSLLSLLRATNRKNRAYAETDRLPKAIRQRPGLPDTTGTLIVGTQCRDGVVIGSDRRVMRGTESRMADKIIRMEIGLGSDILFAAEGLTGIRDDFLLLLDDQIRRQKGIDSLYEAKVIVEDILASLTDRYSQRLQQAEVISVLMGGLDRVFYGEAKLYQIYGAGYGESVDYSCTGHGSPWAAGIAKFVCDTRDLTVEDAADRIAYVISWVSAGELDSSVGGHPQVFCLRNGNPKAELLADHKVQEQWNRVLTVQRDLASTLGISSQLQLADKGSVDQVSPVAEPAKIN
jgi:20S proteasome alpha/beta subunit